MYGAHPRPRCGQPPPEGFGTPASPMPPAAVAAALVFSRGSGRMLRASGCRKGSLGQPGKLG